MTPPPTELTSQDVIEIAIGSAVLGFPVAASEEIWTLSSELSTVRILAIGLTSMIVVAIFVFVVYRRTDGMPRGREFWHRVGTVYGVTLLVCAGILLMLNRFPALTDLTTAIHRTVLVSFPASFSATVVDSLT